jgi:amino acid transporter
MSFFDELKNKPEKTKIKIVWVTVLVIAFLLIVLLFVQINFSFKNINFNNFSKPNIDTSKFKEATEKLNQSKDKLIKESIPTKNK